MSVIKYIETDEIGGILNNGYGIMISKLLKEGVITEEKSLELIEYQFVVVKKGLFNIYWDKFFGVKENDKNINIQVIKILKE